MHLNKREFEKYLKRFSNENFWFFSWVGLVGKNYEIECAIVELEKEVNNLRKQRKSNGTTAMEQ